MSGFRTLTGELVHVVQQNPALSQEPRWQCPCGASKVYPYGHGSQARAGANEHAGQCRWVYS